MTSAFDAIAVNSIACRPRPWRLDARLGIAWHQSKAIGCSSDRYAERLRMEGLELLARSLQQAGHGRAMDQGGKASGALDATVVSSVPGERGPVTAERAGVQPGNLWRRLVLPKRVDSWSLTSLQQRLVKTGGRLVKHARYYWLLLAESHLTRRLFGSMLRRIWALPVPTGWPACVAVDRGRREDGRRAKCQ
jgi:hypothetical protein